MLYGCSAFNNFRAYYNTYYNAKKSFNAGLEKVHDQPVQIDPDQLVRPHRAPVPAGDEQFEEAIDNAGQILSRFPETKWGDDALLLMGKASYYQQNFFQALEKFEALLALSRKSSLKKQAALWKARTLLDISSYNAGVSFLRGRLAAFAGIWSAEQKAEARVLLAEHLAMRGDLQATAEILLQAIPDLESEDLEGRSYFLLGQLYLRLENYEKAYQAFTSVASYNLDFEYEYWARVKAARTAGLSGRTELAISIYHTMLKDDKNYERRSGIYYRLAQVAAQKGDYQRAEGLYKKILANPSAGRSDELRSQTYYQMAQLYSRHYRDYQLAAAYLDSSKRVSVSQNENPQSLSYGRYISLKAQISRIDSLLWLGSLPPARFDSVLTVIRRKKKERLRRQLPINRPNDNTLANISENVTYENPAGLYSTAYGFLNYQNPQMVRAGIQQFRAVWGNRPLVDNWRRIEAVSSVSIVDQNEQGQEAAVSGIDKIAQTGEQLGINLAEIPFNPDEQALMREQKAALHYRLGNLFFLVLDKPDSAVVYYRKVVEKKNNQRLVPKALYSLYQLYALEEMPDRAAYYQQAVLTKFPETVYARQVKQEDDARLFLAVEADSLLVLRQKVRRIVTAPDSLLTHRQRTKELRKLALKHRKSSIAPAIFYQAIRASVQAAKERSIARRDSLQQEGGRKTVEQFMYSGLAWDRVRDLLKTYQRLFPEGPHIERIKIWQQMLKAEQEILTCKQMGIQPTVIGGMQAFVEGIVLPQKLEDMNLSGSVTYQLVINQQGVVDAYQLVSNPTGLGIEQAYEKAIETALQFEPVRYKGEAVQASCEVSFPIKQ